MFAIVICLVLLMCLVMGMTIDYFQITGIRHDVTELLKSAVRYSIALVQCSLGERY